MQRVNPQLRLLLILILLVGIIGIDLVTDLVIYGLIILLILILSSPKKLMPVILPIPITLAIIGTNLIFLKEPRIFRASQFYIASSLALLYSAISTPDEITKGISWILDRLKIKDGETLYGSIVQAKRLSFKNLKFNDIPKTLADLINCEPEMTLPRNNPMPISISDIVTIILATIVSTTVIFS
ncbi:MAG TPA: hypothetical protein EYP58_02775 [bacterium (Candidatus Stahlbacteria)]|nr:hypothetical protein [Candidatus Stahlbacteria bacterium]